MKSRADQAKVMIVGAGAMGLTLGYEFHQAGARIAFLVRPARAPGLAEPQVFYSYDNATLKSFSEFDVLTAADQAGGFAPDYVIVTLDGAATRGSEGTALLQALGKALGATEAVMIGGGVGVGLHQHYLDATGLPSARILMGVLGCFAYQVDRVDLPLHSPTNPELLTQADIAYRHYSKTGLIVEGRPHQVAKRFAELYDRNGSTTCSVVEPHIYNIATNIPFPIYAGSELLGWRPASEMAKNKAIWRLIATAVREIARLDCHGWRGKLAAVVLTDWVVTKMWSTIDRKSLPLDHPAFNAFHHAGKVVVQDMEILQQSVAVGEAEGKSMAALKELIQRLSNARRNGPSAN